MDEVLLMNQHVAPSCQPIDRLCLHCLRHAMPSLRRFVAFKKAGYKVKYGIMVSIGYSCIAMTLLLLGLKNNLGSIY